VIPAEGTERPSPGRDAEGMLFTAEMYGVQLDHLAAVLGVSEARARAIAARWRARGHAETARLGPGRPWTWLTRAGLTACGLPYAAARWVGSVMYFAEFSAALIAGLFNSA